MLNVYLYNTVTGQILATGAYEERGDGAVTRAIALGIVNANTQYAPLGVVTARPVFAPALTLDKSTILANALDTATIANIPNGAVAKIFKDQDALARAAITITDGTLALRVDSAGMYQIVISNFPTQDATFTVQAT